MFLSAIDAANVWQRAPLWKLVGMLLAVILSTVPLTARSAPATIVVGPVVSERSVVVDAVVEAERQATLSGPMPGTVLDVNVRVGDRVRAGQVLVRLDARAADQHARASAAQAIAARAQRDLAMQELARQRALFDKGFISKAAFDQAEARWKAADAETNAQLASADAGRVASDLHTIRAPFNGIVAEAPVNRGDLAVPGRPLMTVYEPDALRVTAAVSESLAKGFNTTRVRIQLPGLRAGDGADAWIEPAAVVVVPIADASTRTVQIRARLPEAVVKAMAAANVVPGAFARMMITAEAGSAVRTEAAATVRVPTSALLRRAEMQAVYVAAEGGRPRLRLVRIGRNDSAGIEIISGLAAGERVYVDAREAATLLTGSRDKAAGKERS